MSPCIPLALSLAALSFLYHPARLAASRLLGGPWCRRRHRPRGGVGEDGAWARGWEVAGPGLGVRPVMLVVEVRTKGGRR